MCAEHPESHVWFRAHEGQNHDSVTKSVQVHHMGWEDDLLSGKEIEQGCLCIDTQPLTDHFQLSLVPHRAPSAL